MYDVEMIKLADANAGAKEIPMLPDSIPGAKTTLWIMDAGEEKKFEPIEDKARIFMTIDGEFSFKAGQVSISVNGRYVFIPGFDQTAEFKATAVTRILEIIWDIPEFDNGRELWKNPARPFPYIQEYITSLQYRDRNKSDKTISREMVRQRVVPGFCMGSVESYGYDKVAQHPHPMLDQFFFSFPENDVDVLIDDFKVPMKGDTLLHIPLGSNHGVEVTGDNHMHYMWIDFFLGQAGLDRLDSSHKHTGTMRSFDKK